MGVLKVFKKEVEERLRYSIDMDKMMVNMEQLFGNCNNRTIFIHCNSLLVFIYYSF